MKKVSIKNLKEGVIFSQPLYTEGNNLLVPAGIAIKKKDLDRLAEWGLDSVETEGEPLFGSLTNETQPEEAIAAGQPDVVNEEDPYKDDPVYKTYTDLIESQDSICMHISFGVAVEASSVDNISSRLLKAVREQRSSFIGYILGGEVKGQGMAKNLVNTAILSALVAMELKFPNHKIFQLITGALLHDVGMLRMPKEIVEKKGGLSQAELQRIQSHPLIAYQIVSKELRYHEDVGKIVLQHHERWDGEGYPGQLAGEDIYLGARIVSVTDAFEAMVSEKPYRNPMMGYQAMKSLLSDNLRRFDPNIIKTFIQTMGIYPIGSTVLLNNGAMAKVVSAQASAPLRPTIQILADESGNTFKKNEGDVIDLLLAKSLFITKAVDPKEKAGRND